MPTLRPSFLVDLFDRQRREAEAACGTGVVIATDTPMRPYLLDDEPEDPEEDDDFDDDGDDEDDEEEEPEDDVETWQVFP